MKSFTVIFLSIFLLSSTLFSQQTQIIYLSGRDSKNTTEWNFTVTGGRKANQWTRIAVPSCWELQGFGTYNYGKDKKPSDEKGIYKKTFTVPATWQDMRVFIVFEGVMTDAKVMINGRQAGPVHQGGFYQFEYDITSLVYPDTSNLLEVTVSKRSSNKSINEAERHSDYWVFGGIYRPVYLKAVPHEYIAWTSIDAKADGTFSVAVHPGEVKKKGQITAQLLRPDGTLLGEVFRKTVHPGDATILLTTKISDYKTWSAESPNLYYVDISLVRQKKIIHTVRKRFGFRTIEVRKGEGIFLNGKRITLKGCDRHSFRPKTGRALSRKDCYDDVMLLKKMNMNAVRMSHYPPDVWFLDYCDEQGIYVLDELAGWQKPPYDTPTGKRLVKEMLVRDVNHPSILFWDNGNEGGWNTALDGEFAKYDLQHRTVLHPWALFNGIDTDHYESYKSVENKLKSGNIFMPTEHLHGLYDGGSGSGLDDFWHLMWGNKITGGMFLWAFADEGVVRTDKNCMIDVHGNMAPDGILGPFHEKEANFFTIQEIWSPVYIETNRPWPENFPASIPVENRYDFTNLNQCSFDWQLVTFPLPGASTTDTKILAQGRITGPDIPARKKGFLTLNLPSAVIKKADALLLTAFNPQGRRLFTWSWKLTNNKKIMEPIVTSDNQKPEIIKNPEFIEVQAGAFTYIFDKRYGLLKKVISGKHSVPFGDGPFIVPVQKQQPRVVPVTSVHTTDSGVVVTTRHHPFFSQMQWTILPGGWLCLDYAFPYEGEVDYLGVSFHYPEDRMYGMKWLGKGPYRVWKNRLKGQTMGVWENRYNRFAPATAWDYPEFPGYYADFAWGVFHTADGDITVVTNRDDLYFRVFSQPEGYEPRHAKMIWPEGDISFLHAIPPIGTKFQDPERLGPQGHKFKASGTYRGKLFFYFAAPKE